MPTRKYENADEAYQALTDLEIENDELDMPCAIIKVRGMSPIKIEMLSEYHFHYVLVPLRNKLINYYANHYIAVRGDENKKPLKERIVERIELLTTELEKVSSTKEAVAKAKTLAHLFADENPRLELFKALKEMGIISRWIRFKKYQMCMRPIDTVTVFTYLWLFNFDGLKKKALELLVKLGSIIPGTNSPSLIASNPSFDMEHYKVRLAEATARVEAARRAKAEHGLSNN